MAVVVTWLLTAQPDPQIRRESGGRARRLSAAGRGRRWRPDPSILAVWAASVRGARAVVLADEATEVPAGAELVRVRASAWSPYRARWIHALDYLHTINDEWVWLTDGSDVEMLREPWGRMCPGVLYLGSEPYTLSRPWMLRHGGPRYRQVALAQPGEPLINCGLVGGDRPTVMAYVRDLLDAWEESGCNDMGPANIAAHVRWVGRFATGPAVHTAFKSYSDNGEAWWRHR